MFIIVKSIFKKLKHFFPMLPAHVFIKGVHLEKAWVGYCMIVYSILSLLLGVCIVFSICVSATKKCLIRQNHFCVWFFTALTMRHIFLLLLPCLDVCGIQAAANLRVCAFNLQHFGESKAKKQDVMQTYAKVRHARLEEIHLFNLLRIVDELTSQGADCWFELPQWPSIMGQVSCPLARHQTLNWQVWSFMSPNSAGALDPARVYTISIYTTMNKCSVNYCFFYLKNSTHKPSSHEAHQSD